MGLTSPNEMLAAARKEMLDGREPQSYEDWVLVMNFMACNIAPEVADAACKLMAVIYEMPLSVQDVEQIVDFQLARL
jgi:hypothetical protein